MSLSFYSYTYDEWGYRIQTDTHEGRWTYKYDAVGQLVEWSSPFNGVQETLQYDSAFNRKSKESMGRTNYYNVNPMYQYADYGQNQNFTYDKNGNLLMKQTANGQTVESVAFLYNQEGRATRIRGRVVCDYQYNVFGAVSRKQCSDGTNISYTIDPFGSYGASILIESTASHKRFIYHGMENGLLSIASAVDPNDSLFYLFDGDGSTAMTADIGGHVKITYTYDPFGRVLTEQISDGNTFRYQALFGIQTLNEISQIILMRSRLYDAEHGRFLTPDPAGVLGSPVNPYNYALNNPLIYKDPTGEFLFLVPAVAALLESAVVAGIAKGALEGLAGYLAESALCSKDPTLSGALASVASGALEGGLTLGLSPGKYKKFFKYIAVPFVSAFYPTYIESGGNLAEATASGAKAVIGKAVGERTKNTAAGILTGSSICVDDDPPKTKPRSVPPPKDRQPDASGGVPWVVSRDTNEIQGPVGYGDGRYISGVQVLEYKIEFENDPNATAPAQLVKITCPLDSNLDLGTFKVGTFAFGNFKKDAGFNSFAFQELADAVQETGTFVFLEAVLDAYQSEARFLFQTIDPNTDLPPTDPRVGFLPPNNGTSGQGYVTFQINMKDRTETLAKIFANASIVFDENPPIDTPTIFNTIDKTPPTVSLNASVVSGGVLIQFDNADIGSGVQSVDLFIVENGNRKLLQSNVDPSGVVLDLPVNSLLNIIAVATDNVNNNGELDLNNVLQITVHADCPENCSSRGKCNLKGVCECYDGYEGKSCSIVTGSFCEPPIIDLYYANKIENVSVAAFLSTRAANQFSSGNLSMVVSCSPAETKLSKGTAFAGVVMLSETDYGDLTITAPEYFTGLVSCDVVVTLVGNCGTANRTSQITFFAMSAFLESTWYPTVAAMSVSGTVAAMFSDTFNTTLWPWSTVTPPLNGTRATISASTVVMETTQNPSGGTFVPGTTRGGMSAAITTQVMEVSGSLEPNAWNATSVVSELPVPVSTSSVMEINGTLQVTVPASSAFTNLSMGTVEPTNPTVPLISSSVIIDVQKTSKTIGVTSANTESIVTSKPTTVQIVSNTPSTPFVSVISTATSIVSETIGTLNTTGTVVSSAALETAVAPNATVSGANGFSTIAMETGRASKSAASVAMETVMTINTSVSASTVIMETNGMSKPSTVYMQSITPVAMETAGRPNVTAVVGAIGTSTVAMEISKVTMIPVLPAVSTAVAETAVTSKTTAGSSPGLFSSVRVDSGETSKSTVPTLFGSSSITVETPITGTSKTTVHGAVGNSTTVVVVDTIQTSKQTLSPLFNVSSVAMIVEGNASATILSAAVTGTLKGTSAAITTASVLYENKTTTSPMSSAWSEWTACSRTCDTGTQQRFRQCLLGLNDCSGDSTDRRLCVLTACPVLPDETTQGSLLTVSRTDATKILGQLDVFKLWIVEGVNRYCSALPSKCCVAVFGNFTSGLQMIGPFTLFDLVSLGTGYPAVSGNNGVFKTIVKVDRNAVRSQCIGTAIGRRKRQSDIAFLDRTIITEALIDTQLDMEKNLSVTILEIVEPTNSIAMTTSPPTSDNSNNSSSHLAIIIGVVSAAGGLLVLIVIVVSVVTASRRQKISKRLGDERNSSFSMTEFPAEQLSRTSFNLDNHPLIAPEHSAVLQVGRARPAVAIYHNNNSVANFCRPQYNMSRKTALPMGTDAGSGVTARPQFIARCSVPPAMAWNGSFLQAHSRSPLEPYS
jgi:RHS repeat-associated protein